MSQHRRFRAGHAEYFEGRRFRFLSLVEDCPGRADIPALLFLCQSELHSVVERQYSSVCCLFIGVLGRVDCTGHFAPITFTLRNQRDE